MLYFRLLSPQVCRLLAAVVATCCYGWAQGVVLSVSPGSGAPGQPVVLNLSLKATGNSPVSTEWTLNYSTTDFISATVALEAADTDKALSCSYGPGTATCLMWGLNFAAIPNNIVASIVLTLANSTLDTSTTVQLANGVSADSTGASIATSVSGGTVTILQIPQLSGISCSGASLTPLIGSTCTVTLTSPAPGGGATIALNASPIGASVPTSVTVAPGSTSASFAVAADILSAVTAVTLTASYSGASATFDLTVNPLPAALAGLSVSPSSLISGLSGTGIVSLTAAAGAGGAAVSLSSSNAAARVPATVIVPQGSTSATFGVSAGGVTVSSPVTLTASYSGVNATFGLMVSPLPGALSGVSVNPSNIVSGQSGTGTVSLTAPAGSGGAVVSLWSSTNVAGVPSSVTIPQGATSASFLVTTGALSASTSVMLTASYSGVNATAGVTITPASTGVPASASFQAMDTTTKGNWRNTYNYPNVTIIGDGAVNATITPVPSGENSYTWTTTGTLVRALENLASTGRVAGRWASSTDFFVDLNFADQAVHEVAIYCLDWNETSRAETISVLDATTNAVLDTRSVSNFTEGVYVVWTVTGHVKLQITKTAGNNAVISGVFLN
jgi:hypothetical protein